MISGKDSMTPREQWLIDSVRGRRVLNIGFVGQKDRGKKLHQAIAEKNPGSTLIPIDLAAQRVIALHTTDSVAGSVFEIPVKDTSVDGVILGELIEHFYEIYPLLQEVTRVLKPGGKVYITTPNVYQPFRWLKHWLLLSDTRRRSSNNARGYLADSDHKVFWEPISLINTLNHLGFEVTTMETKILPVPYLPFTSKLDLTKGPFAVLGEYLCLVAEKSA